MQTVSQSSMYAVSSRNGESLRNRLLARLPVAELGMIQPHLESIALERKSFLFGPDRPDSYVYFPDTAVVSLISRPLVGRTFDISTVGCEGMAGGSSTGVDGASRTEAVVQVAGTARRLPADKFAALSASSWGFAQTIQRYTQAALTQIALFASCNHHHLVEERCACRLLTTQDRVGATEFRTTPEDLVPSLGVRTAAVTASLRSLEAQGAIEYSRGWIAIIDRERLVRASCECYSIGHQYFDSIGPSGINRPTMVPA